ncbi:MAG: hypothetical protein ISN26_07015 [Betaproteobacteria bacterium AqS2]|uniref:Uncharacterized protein n=1 Tax=Candidatus Amphirhobacter heronislandensis TaxID=1732024 RepID=A0A930UIP9_9GAMM|nr:hypothetical protein [Betaproteobacteria bacterium AqS2]
MTGPILFCMALVALFAGLRISRWRRRRPDERLGQWLQRTRRYDAEKGYKDLMLCLFACGLCATGLLFQHRREVLELETAEQALLGLLCFTFTLALPLLVWLTAKEGRKRLAEEEEAKRRFEEQLRSGRVVIREDDEDLDGR